MRGSAEGTWAEPDGYVDGSSPALMKDGVASMDVADFTKCDVLVESTVTVTIEDVGKRLCVMIGPVLTERPKCV